MLLNLLEYHWVEHIDDALILLSRTDMKTVPLAGGTYLLGLQDESIQAVVDLRDLELAYISEDAQGMHIGAMTTLQSMVEAPELKNLAAGILSRAALASSFSRLIRNSATLGGTLGAGAASQADLLTALAVMDAEVLLRSGSKTQLNLSGGTPDRPGLPLSGVTFKGKQERHVPYTSLAQELRPNELIVEVIIPMRLADQSAVGGEGIDTRSAGSAQAPTVGASFLRVGRTPTDIALLNAAALVEVNNGVFQRVRLAAGGVNMEPVRLYNLEKQLEGQPVLSVTDGQNNRQLFATVQTGMADFRPPSDFRASSGYRRASGINLVYRALEEAINVSRWNSMISSEGKA
jgi:CO/xanthine dehydrogenase FAD-binding subunit